MAKSETRAARQAAESESRMLIDALGRRYVLEEHPERIVSLGPAITEILFAIGAGSRVVGVTQYCDFPAEAATRTIVGGFSGATVSMEQVRSLSPDLVILSADMHFRVVSLLDDLGIASFAVEPENFSQVYESIALIGEITGCTDGAAEVIDSMKRKIAQVEERISGREKPGVFWVLSEQPLMSAGRNTFVSEAIDLGGGRNIFDDAGEKWPLVSPEQILLRQPEWILLETFFDLTAMTGSFWRNIPAVREGRMVQIDGDLFYRYGPRLALGVEAIAQILHGDQ